MGSNEDVRAAQKVAAAEAEAAERLRERLQQAESATSAQAGRLESHLAIENQVAQSRLTEELQAAIAERHSMQDSLDHQEHRLGEERKKAKRELSKRTQEMQKSSEEFREEIEEALGKAKDAERTMITRLSTARQDRERTEKRLKTQLLNLQQEYQAEHGIGTEAAEVMARWNQISDELSESNLNLRNSEDECSVLTKKVTEESKKNKVLEKKVKEAGNEARASLETELLRERGKANDEAWERLAAVEDRHNNQLNHINKAHSREIQVVAEQVQEVRGELEKRLDSEIKRSSVRTQELEHHVQVEKKRAHHCHEENVTLKSTLEEVRTELATARAEAESATTQHEALLDVLRHERQIAETQFQQLLQQTEEKQKAIGRLQHHQQEVNAVVAAFTGAPEPAGALPPSASPQTPEPAEATAGGGSLPTTPKAGQSPLVGGSTGKGPPGSAVVIPSARGVGAGEEGVDFMLKQLSFEREAHMFSNLAAELNKMLGEVAGAADSIPSADKHDERQPASGWVSKARKLLEQLLNVHNHITHHANQEQQGITQFKQREKELENKIGKIEAQGQRKCEEAVRRVRAANEERVAVLEEEASHTEAVLQATLERTRSEFSSEVLDLTKRLDTETSELKGVRNHTHALAVCESAAAKKSFHAEEVVLKRQLHHEVHEARVQAHQDILDEQCRGSLGLARLESRAASDCQKLNDEVEEERLLVRAELEELRHRLNKELTATRDEHSTLERHKYRLEARVDQFREDCSEAETELQEVKNGFKRELSLKDTELKALETALQVATNRTASAESQMSAENWDWQREVEELRRIHDEEREVLAKEIGQFQDEKLMLEECLRKDEASSSLVIRHLESELQMSEAELEIAANDPAGFRKGTITMEAVGNIVKERLRSPPKEANNGTEEDAQLKVNKAGLLDRLNHRKQANRLRETMEKQQEEADAKVAEVEEMYQCEQEEKAMMEKELKDQLRTLREERMRERTNKDRQIEKLKARVQELEQRQTAEERRQTAEAAAHRRRHDEHREHLENVKKDKRQVAMTLQESRKERAQAATDMEELEQELENTQVRLNVSEEQRQELATERYAAERSAAAYQLENTKLEAQVAGNQAMLDRETYTLQELQMEREALRSRGRELSNEAQEARSLAERLCLAFEEEIQQLLPALPEDSAQELANSRRGLDSAPSEAAVVHTFQVLARWVADLARQNAEIRYTESQGRLHLPQRPAGGHASSSKLGAASAGHSPAHGSPTSAAGSMAAAAKDGAAAPGGRQVANLQKELIKMREENQELRLELQRLRRQSTDTNGAESPTRQTNPISPSAASMAGSCFGANSVVSEGRTEGSTAPRPLPLNQSGPSNVATREKMRKMQAEKVAAENELVALKQDYARRVLELQSENENLQATLWEQQQQRDANEDASQKKVAQLERRARILEGKLRERTERERELSTEKEAVEEQLEIAAKQLEALLAEEHRDSDLQRDLAGLSKQFELLHGKHRAQLSKAAEQGQALERERDIRQQLEDKLKEVSTQLEEDVVSAEKRHAEQVSQMHEKVQSLQRQGQVKHRELQEALQEQATLTMENSAMKSMQQQQNLTAQDLQDEVKRLQADLERQHNMLREARERGPGARDALLRLHKQEDECALVHKNLEATDAARAHAQAQVRAKTVEIEELRNSMDQFREEAREAQDAKRRAEQALDRSQETSRSPAKSASPERWEREREERVYRSPDVADAASAVRGAPWRSSVERSSSEQKVRFSTNGTDRGTARRLDRLEGLDGDSEEPPCVIRTTEDLQPDSRRVQASSSRQSDQSGLLSALEEIQETLNNRERELQERKAGRTETRSHSSENAGPGPADSPPKSGAGARDEAVPTSMAGSMAEVERDFGEYARSIGYRGDVGPLWAEAQAQAAAMTAGGSGHQGLELSLPPHGSRAEPPPRAPIAADVQLLSPGTVQVPSYPQSPPSGGSTDGFHNEGDSSELGGGYPHSPGRSADWQLAMEAQGPGSEWSAVTQPAGQRSGATASIATADSSVSNTDEVSAAPGSSAATTGRSNQAAQPGLPANARETFRRAEAMQEQGKFNEAVQLFEQVLEMLGAGPGASLVDSESVPPAVVAEVWAHRGVAMQSLDRVVEAIDSYKNAVALDSSLHVCFANLATLHAYLHERDQALEYIAKALQLDPQNATYAQIRRHLDESPPSAARGEKAPTAANAA